ncbi:MAG: hypothetical protein JKY52_12030 [Flavobacteriales bacterium]|nr:hypothetical protein [Flavobacteriales bacterium]
MLLANRQVTNLKGQMKRSDFTFSINAALIIEPGRRTVEKACFIRFSQWVIYIYTELIVN